jgi:Ser-tRNA(Ala) deacylase AlaX
MGAGMQKKLCMLWQQAQRQFMRVRAGIDWKKQNSATQAQGHTAQHIAPAAVRHEVPVTMPAAAEPTLSPA